MKSSELRIGNYLEDWKGNLCKVEKITLDGFEAPAIYEATTVLPNQPIEITSEWLDKLGFIYNENGTYVNKLGYVFYRNSCTDNWLQMPCGDDVDYHIFIKSVHHLQNTYYDLSGTELTLQH